MLSLFCLAAVVLAVLLLTTGDGGSSTPGSYATTVSAFRVHSRRVEPPMRNLAARRAVERTFAGIPQHGPLLGRPDAPVTMRFLADPECPEARQFAVQLLPLLVRRWVRDGRLRIEYVGAQSETHWPAVFGRQQVAVLAAGRQRRLWQYLELFYHYQGPEFTRYAGEWFLDELAREAGLEQKQWRAARHTFRLERRVAESLVYAKARGVLHTPAFLIGPTGGKLRRLLDFTLTEPLAFEAAFEEALADRPTGSLDPTVG